MCTTNGWKCSGGMRGDLVFPENCRHRTRQAELLVKPAWLLRTCLTLRSAEQRSRNWAALRLGLGPRPDKPSRSGTGGSVWHGNTVNVRVAGEWRSVAERASCAETTVACRVMTDAVGCWESLTHHHVEQVRRIFSGIRGCHPRSLFQFTRWRAGGPEEGHQGGEQRRLPGRWASKRLRAPFLLEQTRGVYPQKNICSSVRRPRRAPPPTDKPCVDGKWKRK